MYRSNLAMGVSGWFGWRKSIGAQLRCPRLSGDLTAWLERKSGTPMEYDGFQIYVNLVLDNGYSTLG